MSASAFNTVEGAMLSLIQADAAVQAISAGRCHPYNEPQSIPYPKTTFWRWNSDRSAEVGGLSNSGPTGFAVAKIFVDSWAADWLTAKLLADATRKAINGFTGVVGGITIGCIRIDDEREQPGTLIPATNTPIQRRTLDVRISYQEP